MLRRFLNGWNGLPVLHDAPGEGGGGGGVVVPTEPAAPAAAVPDGGAPDDGGGADDLDDPDDDRAPELDVTEALPEKSVRTHLRRTQRYNSKARPIAEMFRDPQTGRLQSADTVRQTLEHARSFAEIDNILRNSPAAVELLEREAERIARGGQPSADTGAGDDFDEANWPFETESAQGKYLLQMAKDQHESKKVIAQLRGTVEGVQKGTQAEREAALEDKWKAETLLAAKEVDEGYRPLFVRGIYRQFQLLKSQGLLTKSNAKAIVDAELRELRAANKAKTRTTTTRQSAMVAGNGTLPKTPAPGKTTPASPAAPTKRETMKDAKQSFLSKYRG